MSILAGVVPLDNLADMVSIGTLVAFIDRLGRRDHPAGARARSAPGVQGARLSGDARAVGDGVRLHSVQPALVHLDRVQRPGLRWRWCSTSPWGRHHSALNDGGDGVIASAAPGVDDVEVSQAAAGSRRDRRRRLPRGKSGTSPLTPGGRGGAHAAHVADGRDRRAQTVDHAVAGPRRRRIRRRGQTNWPPTPPRKRNAIWPRWPRAWTIVYRSQAHRSVSGGLVEVVEDVDAATVGTRLVGQRPARPGRGRIDRRPAAALFTGARWRSPRAATGRRAHSGAEPDHLRVPGHSGVGGRGQTGRRPGRSNSRCRCG